MLRAKKLIQPPSVKSLMPLLAGGLSVQLRSLALSFGLLSVTRATLSMDSTGTMAAAHSITVNLWQLAGVVLLALSNAATILIPQVRNNNPHVRYHKYNTNVRTKNSCAPRRSTSVCCL